MKYYRKRAADILLKDRLESKGAVLIEGAKWCGKTTTAEQVAQSILYMQDPANKKQNLEMADLNPSILLQGDTPRLIDEWQLAPKLWDAVRFEVDRRDEFGQFILTGSSVPADTSAISHTGTGRISRMLMRTMSLYESGESNGKVSLGKLFQGSAAITAVNKNTLEMLAFQICRGGWPKALDCTQKVALRQVFDYVDAIAEADLSRADGVSRDAERARRLMRSYARHIASQTKLETIRSDITANSAETFSNDTLYSYLNALKSIFVIEDAPAWSPNLRSKTTIRSTDTRYYMDPSIGAAALGLSPGDLIQDLHTMGLLFENLCIRDLRIYTDLLDGTVYHYRDRNDLECDAVIHLRNGSYGLIEVKLGGDRLIEEGAENLIKLQNILDTTKMKEPAFLMIVTGVSPYAYRRKDGVYVVPISCLKY